MANKTKLNPADCSCSELIRFAIRAGFIIFEGGKHTKIKDISGNLITTIPRKNKINKNTAKEIIKILEKSVKQF